jgi:superfamily II DNA or RNA helicase
MKEFYQDIESKTFETTLNTKQEFVENEAHKKKGFLYQEPTQVLIRNYLSQHTTYENILLYHNVGSGKTCTAISVVEGLKEYINNMGRRVVVLVKNKNIQKNFMNELTSKCTGDAYITDEERASAASSLIERKDVALRLQRDISKYYKFITYGTFVNRVLGAKEFEKDEFGRNTTRAKRENGRIKRKPVKDRIHNLTNTVIVVDEAHNVTNNDVYVAMQNVLANSFNTRVVLLTATPMYDNPKEIFEIANILNHNYPELQLPIRNELLKSPYVNRTPSSYINDGILKGGIIKLTKQGEQALRIALKGKVSYLKGNDQNMPRVLDNGDSVIPGREGSVKVIRCKMSKQQYNVYQKALSQDVKNFKNIDLATTIQNIEAVENSFDGVLQTSTTSSLYKNSSDAATMAYPNSQYGKAGYEAMMALPFAKRKEMFSNDLGIYSSKLKNLLNNIQDSNGPVFVYSNYVTSGGTSLIKQVLLHNGFKEYRSRSADPQPGRMFIVYDDSLSVEAREKLRRKFNSKENKHGDIIKILVGSPVISEGITLKNVRQVHVLEPAWNMSRINQIVGRAIRNYSHQDLPSEDRNVEIFKYAAVYNESDNAKSTQVKDFFIDKEKYILSEEKDRANKHVERLLKEHSFDCNLNITRNQHDKSVSHGSAQCDYTKCEFSCANRTVDNQIDKSTYEHHIKTFGAFDIEFLSSLIRDAFKKSFVWSLHDLVHFIKDIEPYISTEVIYTTLGHFVDAKSAIEDMYGREGFIIQRGDYYIFNANDIDVNSSFFSKYLDFSVEKNKYTLNGYLEQKHDINVKKTFGTDDHQERDNQKPLLAADIEYNNHIIRNNAIFGTYRKRSTGEEAYGPIDGKFKIVDLRKAKQPQGRSDSQDDKRREVTGMYIKSFKKAQLEDIARYLDIKTTQPLDQFGKDKLAEVIENYLVQAKRVLK